MAHIIDKYTWISTKELFGRDTERDILMDFTQHLSFLKLQEPQLRLLIDLIEEFIVVKDGSGKWILANKKVIDLYCLGSVEYHGKTDLELAELIPEMGDKFIRNYTTDEWAWENGCSLKMEKSLMDQDGVENTWEVLKTPVFNDEGKRSHLIIVSRNITDRKKSEKLLNESERKFRVITENMKDIILLVDKAGNIQYVSPSFEKILGFDSRPLKGESLFTFLHNSDVKDMNERFAKVSEKKHVDYIFEFRLIDGSNQYRWFEANGSCVRGQTGEIDSIILASREISERKEYELRLDKMAYQNYLTKIPNRRSLMKLLPNIIKDTETNKKIFALVFLDLDFFKQINDTYGHEMGDRLLALYVRRIEKNLRFTDSIARVGGDEFVITLEGLNNKEEAETIISRLCESLKQPWVIDDEHLLKTSSSMGIALYPNDGSTIETLLNKADTALYSAKKNGRGQYQFYSESAFL